MVRTGGLEPPPPCGEQIFIPLRLSPPPLRRSWSGLSLRHSLPAVGAARLVSTPSPEGAWLGIGLGCPLAFPDFEQFYSTSFPAGTPTEVCCVYRFATSAFPQLLVRRATARGPARVACGWFMKADGSWLAPGTRITIAMCRPRSPKSPVVSRTSLACDVAPQA